MTTEYDKAMTTEFPTLGAIQFPRSYTPGRKAGQPSVIFIHTTEGSEGRTSAEDGAAYDKRRTDGTSTHFFVDQDTTVQCVPTYDEAHAAREHGNDVGIQIEVCGKAGQSATQWADDASQGAIRQAARVAVLLRKKYPGRFPLAKISPAELRAGKGHGFAESQGRHNGVAGATMRNPYRSRSAISHGRNSSPLSRRPRRPQTMRRRMTN
jgi:hypothetical protein